MPAKLPTRFTKEEAARSHLESKLWPDGPVCPHCGVIDRASRIKGGRAGLLFCNACRKQFSVTVGTVFERSKVPLHTWLYANHLLCSSKKGISSQQLTRFHKLLQGDLIQLYHYGKRVLEGMDYPGLGAWPKLPQVLSLPRGEAPLTRSQKNRQQRQQQLRARQKLLRGKQPKLSARQRRDARIAAAKAKK